MPIGGAPSCLGITTRTPSGHDCAVDPCGGSLAVNVNAADVPPACDGGADEIFCNGFDGSGGPPVIAAGWVEPSSDIYPIAYAAPTHQWAPTYQGGHRFAAPVN